MPGSARIDELKKKFDEHPGRYFAPLANEYRKAGEIEQAITICRTYLAEKPGHMSGLIVFGQALYEATQYEESRVTFEQALGLDPENLIALRHLGDIARDVGDPAAARGWYQRVLDADPRNEEIAAQLAAVSSAAAATPAAATAPAESSGMSGWGDINPEQPSTEQAATSAASTLILEAVTPPSASPFADPEETRDSIQLIALDDPASTPDIERDGPILEFEPSGFASTSTNAGHGDSLGIEHAQDFAVSGSGRSTLGDIELDRPFEMPPDIPSASAGDLGLEVSEFTPPSRDEMASPADFGGILAFDSDLLPAYEPEARTEPAAAAPVGDARQESEKPVSPAPAGFVTETMAELYLKQGYRAEAINVYRQLVEQHPDDPSLREKLRSAEGGEPTTPADAAASAKAPAARKPDSRTGPTAREFFGSLASRRAPVRSSDPAISAVQPAPSSLLAESGVTGPSDWIMEPAGPLAAEPAPSPVVAEAFGGADDDWPEPSPAPEIESTAADAGWGIAPVTAVPASPAAAPAPTLADAGWGIAPVTPASASPAMTGSLDSLFAGAAIPSADNVAAATLADAFGPPEPSAPAAVPTSTPQRGQPTRAASNELSLDHVFRDSPRKSGAVRQTGGFSFDQFFSDGAAGREKAEGTGAEGEATPAEGTAKTDDDVGQFTSWLEGLKKK